MSQPPQPAVVYLFNPVKAKWTAFRKVYSENKNIKENTKDANKNTKYAKQNTIPVEVVKI